MFPKNTWYVAAAAHELGRAILKRTIAEEQIVLYRTEAGAPVAMLDMCPHRHAPLSLGRLVGDNIECGYHGITFDCTGKCVRIPGTQATNVYSGLRRFYSVALAGVATTWGETAQFFIIATCCIAVDSPFSCAYSASCDFVPPIQNAAGQKSKAVTQPSFLSLEAASSSLAPN
jgi:nitrite reductase/ring-hydroxylating ferredoxin subunit